ncbi:hypothetical protein RchiOBHm_Chr6g0255311 [Rosa chinensis]|uniref:Uncharacterized protein n=1 Tax=Rosa chinensis TaxID=74649 RepID=A0A2P6PLU6_ROSCH|nr:hypothetical protein RchiOBHm_Chr6g0255311 [Rosa chinensis]
MKLILIGTLELVHSVEDGEHHSFRLEWLVCKSEAPRAFELIRDVGVNFWCGCVFKFMNV